MNVGVYGMPAGDGYANWSVWESDEEEFRTGVIKFKNALGRLPVAMSVVLRCVISNNGYIAGDEVHPLIKNAGVSTTGMSVGVSERDITLHVGGVGWLPSPKTNPTTIPNLPAASWAIRVNMAGSRSAGVTGFPWQNCAYVRPFITDARPISTVSSLYAAFQCPHGRRAVVARPMARCLIGNNGYVPGDVVALGQVSLNPADPIVVTVGVDTRLEVSANGPPPIVPSGGGAPVPMVANQWQLFVQGLA